MTDAILHVVHCIDTEGPLDETLEATFQRLHDLFGIKLEPSEQKLKALQAQQLPLGGLEADVAAVVAPPLLAYNRNWNQVRNMLEEALSPGFRYQMVDDVGKGWVYSWHCVDHLGYTDNPRNKDLGYGKIFHFYRDILEETGSSSDEINWHFHPLSLTRQPLAAATCYANTMQLLVEILARRVLDDRWFPTTSRPGFHAERPDSHAFLEQWIPFDYANQACENANTSQSDTQLGRFGDWSRAPQDWLGYQPNHDDYQQPGQCRRWIFRCLNVGTRLRSLRQSDVVKAFENARTHGSAILAFADHDFRDIRLDVNVVRKMLDEARNSFPEVRMVFSGAEAAARSHLSYLHEEPHGQTKPEFKLEIVEGRLFVHLEHGSLFGPQPFLALQDRGGNYYHDNLDVVKPGRVWAYVLDDQTLRLENLHKLGVGGSGSWGGYGVAVIDV